MPARLTIRLILGIGFFCMMCTLVQGQTKKHAAHHRKADTSLIDLTSKISDSILQETEIRDTTVPYMVNKIESYSFSLNRAENFLDRRMDTTGILNSLAGLERGLKYFRKRLDQNDNPMNLRNLNTAAVLLSESREKLEGWEKTLSAYASQLNDVHQKIRLVKHDSSLLNDSLDAILRGEMKAVRNRSLELDSVLHSSTIRANTLRNRVSINYLLVKDLQTEINDHQHDIREGLFKQEEAPFPDMCATDYDVSLPAIISDALTRSTRVVRFFMKTTWDTRAVNLGIWILLLSWFLIILRTLRKLPDPQPILQNLLFLKKSALICSLLLLFTYGPFLYASVPAAYVHVDEIFRIILLSILLLPYLRKTGRLLWLVIACLWVIFALDDILLDSALGERWGLMAGAVLLVAVCIILLRKKTLVFRTLDESKARYLVVILSLAQIIFSIACNMTGRITLCKLFAYSAIDSLVLAITLKVCCTILVDAVYTQSEVFHNRFFAFLNFVDLKKKLRSVLWVVAIFVWIVSIIRNLMMYDQVSFILLRFINSPRTIGSFTFSFASGLLFILIIWISSVLSQFVNYFFDERHNPGPQKKTKLGSIALIVRIGIWTAGFFIAVAAAGIPINKISILIGALGVGIGFGLQNLVNNLVSGIIIAFERPIQIGDTIEIGGKTGLVQEIGVRSSQISNGEGANIIIPNGDLLSQQLVNWTLHNRNKRIKVPIGIPYKSDYRKARELILQEIGKDDQIMKDPRPAVTVENFASEMVNFEIKFWVPDMSEVGTIRNELMMNIIDALTKNGISMDLPKK